jgi:hypothetical protein
MANDYGTVSANSGESSDNSNKNADDGCDFPCAESVDTRCLTSSRAEALPTLPHGQKNQMNVQDNDTQISIK